MSPTRYLPPSTRRCTSRSSSRSPAAVRVRMAAAQKTLDGKTPPHRNLLHHRLAARRRAPPAAADGSRPGGAVRGAPGVTPARACARRRDGVRGDQQAGPRPKAPAQDRRAGEEAAHRTTTESQDRTAQAAQGARDRTRRADRHRTEYQRMTVEKLKMHSPDLTAAEYRAHRRVVPAGHHRVEGRGGQRDPRC